MISGVVSSYPNLHGGIGPNYWFSYSFLRNNHTCTLYIPPSIILDFWYGQWWLFLVNPGICIRYPISLSALGHEYSLRLLHWVLVSCWYSCYSVFSQCLFYQNNIFPCLENSSQNYHFNWGDSPKHPHERPRVVDTTCWLKWCLDCSDIFLHLHCVPY